jgi:homocitrate synthase NifV
MIKITDMTLSLLGGFSPTVGQYRSLLELIQITGADHIEIPAAVYERLALKPSLKYILRITNPEDTRNYPGITRFVCRLSGIAADPSLVSEIQINDVRELNFLSRYGYLQNVRIVGLDDILQHDYGTAFENIKRYFPGRLEFCPENSLYLASASAVEWAVSGGVNIVASFGGLGGKASLEEVIISLRIAKRYKPGSSYAVFPLIAKLMEEICSTKYPPNKTIVGEKIFDVESGIHIDGILKKPEMYEPFLPELVGGARKIIIGKHSGKKALGMKLKEYGINPEHIDLGGLLGEVRIFSVEKMSGLSDEELLELSGRYRK